MPCNDPRLFQFPQLFTVEASAGSGKTYSLTRRYLQLLINPRLRPEEIPLEAILAITFTNKAALEMKQRILELLKKIALDNFSDQEEKRALIDFLAVDQTQARQKAFLIMEQILKNYNFFQVQTIDSFINTILSGCAFKLDLSANFTTEKEYRQYLALGLDLLIERAHEDKALMGIFHNFLKQYLYLENRPGWFPKEQILSIITALYSKSAKFSGNFLASSINYTDILKLKEEILKLMRKLQDQLPEGTHKTFVKALALFLGKNNEHFDLEDVSDFFRSQDYPLNKGYLIAARIQKLWQQIRGGLKDLAEDESLFAYNYYIEIFNAALSDLKALASRDDILFLEALNKEASGLFQEKSLNLPELYWRLATRYEHFLLDEFQDTSRLQWENLYPMVKEALSSSGSLFFVGDKKQAVYRFRGGDAALIDSVQEEFQSIFSFREALARNFRSQRQIVEFNNLIFSSSNLKRFMGLVSLGQKGKNILGEEDIAFVLHEFAAARQEYLVSKSGGYVRVERLDASKGREKEALVKEKLVSLIGELSLRFNPGDIAILVRKNDDAQKVSSWLLQEAIPVESETTLDIRQNAYVKELVSFLRFLNSPIDELSFASFISGDIFSRAAKIENQKIRDFLFDLNCNRKDRSYLYREFRRAFPCAWEALLDEFFKNVGFVPLYELVVSILGKFRVFQEFAEYQAFFMGFLELIRLQEDKYSSISEFLDFFQEANSEDLYVNSSSHQAVKVFTIHKSKGLEFPVVVVPFLEINIKIDGEIVIREEQGLKLLYSKARYADFSPRLRQIRSREYLLGLIDELNAIYVALTRAAQELYLLVPGRGERGANIACALFPQAQMESGQKSLPAQKSAGVTPAIAIPASEYKDWIGLLKDEFVEEGVLSQRGKVQRGQALHSILSHIGNLYQQDKELAMSRALQAAQAKFTFIADSEEYALILWKLLNKKDLAVYFELAQGEAFTEYEVVNCFGDTKRIDRLVISASEAVVIDYKSDKYASGDHKEQVRGYMSMIREIYPQLKVKGVLLYLDDLSIEEVT